MSPAALSSQLRGTLTGEVHSTDETAIPNATVTVLNSNYRATTGEDGRFALYGLPQGNYTFEVKKLGFRAVLLKMEIVPHAIVDVKVTMAVQPATLVPVEVTSTAGLTPELLGFEERRARGRGHFFNREEILRMQPRQVTDVLRRVPGLRLEPAPGPYGTGYIVHMGRTTGVRGARPCPALFYVNGVPFVMRADMAINHYLTPEDLAAVEVYSGASTLPPQFHSSHHDARCGVVAVWTYGGERRSVGRR